jgi:hypothetical protein
MTDKIGDRMAESLEAGPRQSGAPRVPGRDSVTLAGRVWSEHSSLPRIVRLAIRYDQRLRHRGRNKDLLGIVGYDVINCLAGISYFVALDGRLPLRTVARLLGRPLLPVSRAMARLERHGFVERVRRYGHSGSRAGTNDDPPIL